MRWMRGLCALATALALAAGGPVACGAAGDGGGAMASATDGGSPAASSDCASCHMADFRGARGHVGQRPTTCAVCHAPDAWHPTGLHHDFWPLTGKHEKTKCFDCHTGEVPVFHGTGEACVACHRPEYEKAPGHAGRFPTTCEQCHSTTAWKPLLPGHPAPPRPASAAPPALATPTPPPRPAATPAPPAPRPPRPAKPKAPPPPPQYPPWPDVEPTTGASSRQ